MASEFDFGTDEDSLELRKLNDAVLQDPEDFSAWEALITKAESQEGGLNRNSNPNSITFARLAYDKFLAKFPLYFGFWKKYADMEFSIAGTEAAEMVYERGVASVSNSPDLWQSYCGFKADTTHDNEVIRELFERGASCVGIDFQCQPFWDKYIEFEERLEAQDKVFQILERVIHIPCDQFQRYFDLFTRHAQHRPIADLAPEEVIAQFKSEIEMESGQKELSELELERRLRERLHSFHQEIFNHTQTEVMKRWNFEKSIKRPYFHIFELEEAELVNWRKYLDFEEVEGDHERTRFLYDRCLVTCALYDEFWLRYARWMMAQQGKEEEVRIIYQKASTIYVPISRPHIRHQYALFEEMSGRPDVAEAIYQAILLETPQHIDTILSWSSLQRRQKGFEAAIAVLKDQIDSQTTDIYIKGALVAEWARLIWKVKGSVEEARQIYQKQQQWYLDVKRFWISYFNFELEQPTSKETEEVQYARIRNVVDDVRRKTQLPPAVIKDIVHYYQVYLLDRGVKDVAKEYLTLDKEVNGPFSVQSVSKTKLAEDGKESTTDRRLAMENGHPGVAVDDSAIRRGENPYTKYYQQQGETEAVNAPLRYS
ncbi:pre-mRNA-processing factor 39 [Eremomyces bilateralis CBS 781.70]|uniref:Pre-mRNA-processing factor 39 n=1 Tax=Eremomyces bilateralis CBS 781.70 TaxID=1392243 RepID=A0A6G1GCQ0_9PEZI|nr:pre-mRNA-processing factor 39 [Eremomyces bilateralis CBS 781.70]KAF1815868.1 pre-mRNA-processing factor 39 [Eremomyces bilateralis CBS 781.70]